MSNDEQHISKNHSYGKKLLVSKLMRVYKDSKSKGISTVRLTIWTQSLNLDVINYSFTNRPTGPISTYPTTKTLFQRHDNKKIFILQKENTAGKL